MAGQVCHTLKPPFSTNTYGKQINRILEDAAPPLRFVAVHSVPVQKIGGVENEVFAIFDVLELEHHHGPMLAGKDLDLVETMVKNLRRENERLVQQTEEQTQQNRRLIEMNYRIRQMADDAVGAVAKNDDRHRESGAEGAVKYLVQQYRDFEKSFQLYDAAIASLTKAYRHAHPGFDVDVIPDTGRVAQWAAQKIADFNS